MPSKSKPTRRNIVQEQLIANRLSEARQLIETARSHPEIVVALAERGYDTNNIAEGWALYETAQQAFLSRPTTVTVQKQAKAILDGAEATAREIYADFRKTARAVFTSPADRNTLGLSHIISSDVQKFLTAARAAYTVAQTTLYADKLAAHGYPLAALQTALTTLNTLATAHAAYNSAMTSAAQATADRDEAVKALDRWIGEFRKATRLALRHSPELIKKLGL
jgi:hypothetical protein